MSRIARVALGPKNAFVAVRLPKGVKSATALSHGKYGAALDRLDQRVSTAKGCVLFFVGGKKGKKGKKSKRKVGPLKAVQRCENRKLKGANTDQCRNKKNKFVKCKA